MLQILGLGYPRTGTMSLKHALEFLGFGPCYHMIEVFQRPQDVPFWKAAAGGEDVDWKHFFREFSATTDAPACRFWRELMSTFPQALCILTVRDPDSWYESFHSTVYQAMTHPEQAPDEDHRSVQCLARQLILDQMFEERFEDRDFAIRTIQRHNREVKETVDPDRLLVFDVSSGWQPLCHFLNVPVPEVPFPRSNTRSEFQQRFPGARSDARAART